MNKRITLIICVTMIFSIIYSVNLNIFAITDEIVNIKNGNNPRLIFSNIKNNDTNVPINKTITLTFDRNIKLDSGNIELFNRDDYKKEKIDISIDDNVLVIKPINKMENFSRYILTLEKSSIVDLDNNSIHEISYYFVTVEETKDDDSKDKEAKEKTYGLEFGRTLGQLKGYIDSLNGKKNNWKKAIPSNKEITNEYNLSNETNEYRSVFLKDFEEGFIKGYEEAFRSENFNIILNSHDEGKEQGEFFGILLGEIHGRRDFYNNNSNDWTRWIPSDIDIIKDYNLFNDNEAYSESFIKGFKNSYKDSYISFFRLTNVENVKKAKENGLIHGRIIGKLTGKNQGKLDYISDKNKDWKLNLLSDDIIIDKYNLNRESIEYKEGFLVGYKDGFMEGYVTTFQDNNLEVAEGNLNNTYISMKGGEISSFDQAVKLKIEPGSFYEEAAISIEKTKLSNLYSNNSIVSATYSYSIKIQNILNSIKLRKPIKIEFEYYGSEAGGIYEFKNGKWFYLYSKIDGNKIYADINTNKYSGGTYAVFIDEKYEVLDDMKGHWAEEATIVLFKRGYISGYSDKRFRPDQTITRAEFIKILDNMHNWDQYLTFINNNNFKDSMVFGSYSNSIAKAVSLGYINGYSDNTFRPHMAITYQEIEWIIQRLTGKIDFKWDKVAEKILNDHYVRSESYNNKQNLITRSEIVYLLYLLEQGLL